MCRIVGIVSKEAQNTFEDGLKSMLRSIAHGGPDDEGTYVDGGVAFGHRRLLSSTYHLRVTSLC